MIEKILSAEQFLPSKLNYKALHQASKSCRGCELYLPATQTVFGEGNTTASLMLIGEQPGNEEDLAGHPFVGSAGKLLQRALQEAGISRENIYITNAVKHFRFEERGTRRVGKQPALRNIRACKPWLEAEIAVVNPSVILCLGAVAAKALLGSAFALTKHRGEWQPGPGDCRILTTLHPSAALRAPDSAKRAEIYAAIVEDLKKVAAKIQNKQ
jgi:DNA polymerase